MSLKSSKPKRSPRAMPMETIITRFKSAQQKRQENKHTVLKSFQPIKQVPKSKTKIVNSKLPKEGVKTINKIKKVETEIGSNEFHPDKLKRKVLNKKVILAPKHSLKIIGGTKSSNKRKLHIPQKDVRQNNKRLRCHSTSSSNSKSPNNTAKSSTDLSVRDMVHLIEDEGSLDEEDLLEILTCPSPVWWEDPPDGYIEESIFSREKPDECISIKSQLLEEQSKEAERKRKLRAEKESTCSSERSAEIKKFDILNLNISVSNRDEKFINKRYKLESLLGDIRNKSNKHSDNKNMKNKIRIKTPEDINGQKFECKRNINKNGPNNDIATEERIKKDETFEDANFLDLADDEIFNLENMEIPIASEEKSSNSTSLLENDLKSHETFKVLLNDKNKNESIQIDQTCIDLSSDDSNDGFAKSRGKETNRAIQYIVQKKSTHNKSLNQDTATTTKTHNATINLDINDDIFIENNSESSSSGVVDIKACCVKENNIKNILKHEISSDLSLKSNTKTSVNKTGIVATKSLLNDKDEENKVPKDSLVKNESSKSPKYNLNQKDYKHLCTDINERNYDLDNRLFEDLLVVKHYDSSSNQVEKSKIPTFDNKVFKIPNDRSRNNSTNSSESDKNMSEEYLDMSLFEDDDIKEEVINENASRNFKDNSKNYLEQLKKNIISTNEESMLMKDKDAEKLSNKITHPELNVSPDYKNDDKTEYVSVYKIIYNDSDNDINIVEIDEVYDRQTNNDIIIDKPEDTKATEKVNRKLDSYYKQRKTLNKVSESISKVRKGESNHETKCITCNNQNKSIVISASETIKYCLACSSIFDTEECKYCIKKKSNNCCCKSNIKNYICDICHLKLNSKHDIITHLSEHHNDSTDAWDHIYT